jgi:hypothetical protein
MVPVTGEVTWAPGSPRRTLASVAIPPNVPTGAAVSGLPTVTVAAWLPGAATTIHSSASGAVNANRFEHHHLPMGNSHHSVDSEPDFVGYSRRFLMASPDLGISDRIPNGDTSDPTERNSEHQAVPSGAQRATT